MKFGPCLLTSAVLHGAALFSFVVDRPQPHPIAIEVTIRQRPVAADKKTKTLRLKPAKAAPRLGSEAYRRAQQKMGDVLASEHYLDRLHAHIDPNWIYFVQQTRLKTACRTVLYIDADKGGTVLAVVVTQNTCPARLRQAAIDAIWYANLLPPPKFLLDKAGILKLEWSFTLKPKDD